MHSSRELRSSSFEVRVHGRPARLEDLFEAFGEQDRLGVVMSRPCGAVGASALIAATITAFYDLFRSWSRAAGRRTAPGLVVEGGGSADRTGARGRGGRVGGPHRARGRGRRAGGRGAR
jgi:hypothetical protein